MRCDAASATLAVLLIFGGLISTGCASTILLRSEPQGAEIYVDGRSWGTSPVKYTDRRMAGAVHKIELRLEGYETLHATFKRNGDTNVPAAVGGICLFPLFWVFDYPATALYRLQPIDEDLRPSLSAPPFVPIDPKPIPTRPRDVPAPL